MADYTLYMIVDELAALLDSIDMTQPGSPERAQCEHEIQAYMRALPAKVDNVARLLEHWKSQVALAKSEVVRLGKRQVAFERSIKRLEGYVIGVLVQLPEPKHETRRLIGNTSTLALGKYPPSVNILNEKEIPARYLAVIPAVAASTRPDKDAIKKAIQAGEKVDGAELVTDKQKVRVL